MLGSHAGIGAEEGVREPGPWVPRRGVVCPDAPPISGSKPFPVGAPPASVPTAVPRARPRVPGAAGGFSALRTANFVRGAAGSPVPTPARPRVPGTQHRLLPLPPIGRRRGRTTPRGCLSPPPPHPDASTGQCRPLNQGSRGGRRPRGPETLRAPQTIAPPRPLPLCAPSLHRGAGTGGDVHPQGSGHSTPQSLVGEPVFPGRLAGWHPPWLLWGDPGLVHLRLPWAQLRSNSQVPGRPGTHPGSTLISLWGLSFPLLHRRGVSSTTHPSPSPGTAPSIRAHRSSLGLSLCLGINGVSQGYGAGGPLGESIPQRKGSGPQPPCLHPEVPSWLPRARRGWLGCSSPAAGDSAGRRQGGSVASGTPPWGKLRPQAQQTPPRVHSSSLASSPAPEPPMQTRASHLFAPAPSLPASHKTMQSSA